MSKGIILKAVIDSDPSAIMEIYRNGIGLLVFDIYDKNFENGNVSYKIIYSLSSSSFDNGFANTG